MPRIRSLPALPASRGLRRRAALLTLSVLVPAILTAAEPHPAAAGGGRGDAGIPRSPLAGLAEGAPPATVIARINGHPIRLADVYASIAALAPGDQSEAREHLGEFAETLVREEILFRSVADTDFEGDPELRRKVREVVFQHLVEKNVRSRIKVSDADVQAFYRQNPDLVRGEHIRVRHILLRKREQCEALMAQIGSEEEFVDAAATRSLDRRTAAEGGDLGYFMHKPGPLGFEMELFKLGLGGMRVFENEDGCHIVRVVEHIDPPLPPLGKVAPSIRSYLEDRAEVRLLNELVAGATARVKVEWFPAGRPKAPAPK